MLCCVLQAWRRRPALAQRSAGRWCLSPPPPARRTKPNNAARPSLASARRLAAKALEQRKLGLLVFSRLLALPPADMLPIYLVAACDPGDAVSTLGDSLLKKRCGVYSPKHEGAPGRCAVI